MNDMPTPTYDPKCSDCAHTVEQAYSTINFYENGYIHRHTYRPPVAAASLTCPDPACGCAHEKPEDCPHLTSEAARKANARH